MGVLLAMAVYSTEENKKDDCLLKTLQSLEKTVDFNVHKLRLSVNGATEQTKRIIETYEQKGVIDFVFYNPDNLGTAMAVNKVWQMREPGQHCIKCDDDFIVEEVGWLDRMVRCIEREPNIAIIGLKRTDCWENDKHEDPYYRSELVHLPHIAGQEWLMIEKVRHVIGTCQLYSSQFLDKIGYLFQPSKYGYDDVLASWRAYKAGMITCFYPYTSIHHIDPGNTPYQSWKERHSGEVTQLVIDIKNEYMNGTRPIYYNPFE